MGTVIPLMLLRSFRSSDRPRLDIIAIIRCSSDGREFLSVIWATEFGDDGSQFGVGNGACVEQGQILARDGVDGTPDVDDGPAFLAQFSRFFGEVEVQTGSSSIVGIVLYIVVSSGRDVGSVMSRCAAAADHTHPRVCIGQRWGQGFFPCRPGAW